MFCRWLHTVLHAVYFGQKQYRFLHVQNIEWHFHDNLFYKILFSYLIYKMTGVISFYCVIVTRFKASGDVKLCCCLGLFAHVFSVYSICAFTTFFCSVFVNIKMFYYFASRPRFLDKILALLIYRYLFFSLIILFSI